MKLMKDMTQTQLFYFAVICVLAEAYSIIITYQKVINGKSINEFLLFAFVAYIVIFGLLFFAQKNKFWKIGFLLLLISGLLHSFARLSSGISSILIIWFHYIAFLILILGAVCFVVMFIKQRK
jgi:hypothetical protein